MNTKYVVLGICTLGLLASCSSNVSNDSEASTSTISDSTTEVTINEPVVLANGYAEYDASLLGETENTVLFFHAPYCGTCTQTDKNLKASGIDEDTTVLKLDYDTNTELAREYGVTKYHTFVQIDANGNMIKKWSGSLTAEDINEQLESSSMMNEKISMSEGEEDTTQDENTSEEQDVVELENTGDLSIEVETSTPVELSSGVYTDFSQNLVGSTENTVLFFMAPWCPSCVSADSAISSGELPSNLTVLRTDFDTSTDLRKQYGVTSQHTFVQIDSEGNLIKKWAGGNSIEDIVSRVN